MRLIDCAAVDCGCDRSAPPHQRAPSGGMNDTLLCRPSTSVRAVDIVTAAIGLRSAEGSSSSVRPAQPLPSASPPQPCWIAIWSLCDSRKGGTSTAPASTCAAVDGSTSGPTLAIHASRRCSYSGASGASAGCRPKLCPAALPDKVTRLLLDSARLARADW